MISEQQLFEYFTRKLNGKAEEDSLIVEDDTVCYLGNLLTHYSHSKNFFTEESGGKQLPTLALLYRDARESNNTHQRQNLLRKLGDSALFMGAWFAVLYQRKGIGKDYFIGMGTAAYDYLAEHALHQQAVFKDLAVNLPSLMRLVSRVLCREENLSAEEIFALYKRWLCTPSSTLEQQLQALGVLPVTATQRH